MILLGASLLAVNTFFAVESLMSLSRSFLQLKHSIDTQNEISLTIRDLVFSELSVTRYFSRIEAADSLKAEIEAELTQRIARFNPVKPAATENVGDFMQAIVTRYQRLKDAIAADIAHSGWQPLREVEELQALRNTAEGLLSAEVMATEEKTAQFERAGARAAVVVSIFALGTLALAFAIHWTSRRQLAQRTRINRKLASAAKAASESAARLQNAHDDIAYLNNAGSLLQSCGNRDEIADLVRDILKRVAPGSGGGIYVYGEGKDGLARLAHWGAGHAPAEIAAADCWGLRLGQIHCCEAGSGLPVCRHYGEEPGDVHAICLPLVSQGETLGLLTIDALPERADSRHADTLRMAEMLARQLGLTLSNVNLRKSLTDQLIKDPLTGAFNRRHMQAVIEREMGEGAIGPLRPLSLAMIDIDHFKAFNDLHGHVAGDGALVSVVRFLQARLRPQDVLFRFGGEEFAVLLPDTTPAAAARQLDGLRAELGRHMISLDDRVLPPVTISVGIAESRAEDRYIDLVKAADEQLYLAKIGGRNRICHGTDAAVAADERATQWA